MVIDFAVEHLWVLWLAVAAVMLFIEIGTAALVSIWFVFGAVVTAIAAVFVDSFAVQVVLFFVFSGVFLVLFRNMYKKKLGVGEDSKKLNYSLIGKTASAAEQITRDGGKVLVGDIYWRAVCECETDPEIPEGTRVIITGEDGTTLRVRKKDPD